MTWVEQGRELRLIGGAWRAIGQCAQPLVAATGRAGVLS